MANEELVNEIVRMIGALAGSTQNKEAIRLLNEMLQVLFKVQTALEDD